MTQMTRADEIANEFESSSEEGSPADAPAAPSTANGSDAAAPAPSRAVNGNGGRQHGPLHLNGHLHLPASRPADSSTEPKRTPGALAARREPDAPEPASRQAAPAHAAQHETLPGIARAAAGGFLQAAGWTAGTSLRVSNGLRRMAVDPSSAQEVIDEVTHEVREIARDFLGITELDAEVKEMAPLLSSGLLRAGGSSPEALRAQGEALLRAAADVGFDESAHPAFARILTELSPDEARILRLLFLEGSQPLVDVRASNLIGNGSQLIAQSLNMLGPQAGLRDRGRVPVYLTNLARLSLVVLSDDSLESPVQYQVLEAQPEVLATLRDTVRAKTIRRSIRLTPLGHEFCEVCLPVNLPQLPAPHSEA